MRSLLTVRSLALVVLLEEGNYRRLLQELNIDRYYPNLRLVTIKFILDKESERILLPDLSDASTGNSPSKQLLAMRNASHREIIRLMQLFQRCLHLERVEYSSHYSKKEATHRGVIYRHQMMNPL